MERMWAGWRAEYVVRAADGPDGEDRPGGGDGGDDSGPGSGDGGAGNAKASTFRRILESGSPDDETHIVWRGRRTFAILNAYPYTSGHLLVMPYREVPHLEELTGDESVELWAAVTDAVVAVKAAYRPQGVNVGANLGEAAGAGIPGHLHVHVLPRWNADSNFMTSVAEARVLPETLGASWRKLREAWPTPPAS